MGSTPIRSVSSDNRRQIHETPSSSDFVVTTLTDRSFQFQHIDDMGYTTHEFFIRNNPADSTCRKETETITAGKVLRSVIPEISFDKIPVVVRISHSSGKPLIPVRQSVDRRTGSYLIIPLVV